MIKAKKSHEKGKLQITLIGTLKLHTTLFHFQEQVFLFNFNRCQTTHLSTDSLSHPSQCCRYRPYSLSGSFHWIKSYCRFSLPVNSLENDKLCNLNNKREVRSLNYWHCLQHSVIVPIRGDFIFTFIAILTKFLSSSHVAWSLSNGSNNIVQDSRLSRLSWTSYNLAFSLSLGVIEKSLHDINNLIICRVPLKCWAKID